MELESVQTLCLKTDSDGVDSTLMAVRSISWYQKLKCPSAKRTILEKDNLSLSQQGTSVTQVKYDDR